MRNWKPRRCRKLMSFPFWGGGKEEEWELPSIIIIVLISPLDTCAKQTGSLHSSAKAVFCNFLWNVPSRKDITEPQPSPSRGHPFLLLLLLHLPREKLLFLSSLIYRNRIPTSISPEINLLSPATDDVSWRLRFSTVCAQWLIIESSFIHQIFKAFFLLLPRTWKLKQKKKN